MRWAVEERGLDRIGSNVQAPKEASHRTLRRLGFTSTGTRPVPRDPTRTADRYVWTAQQAHDGSWEQRHSFVMGVLGRVTGTRSAPGRPRPTRRR